MADIQRRSKKRYSKQFYIAKAIALAIFPFILLVLPKSFFDHGPQLCLYTLLTGENCYGCGMTRACMRLAHLDIAGAMSFNKISLIVFPILCGLLLAEFLKTVKVIRSWPADTAQQ